MLKTLLVWWILTDLKFHNGNIMTTKLKSIRKRLKGGMALGNLLLNTKLATQSIVKIPQDRRASPCPELFTPHINSKLKNLHKKFIILKFLNIIKPFNKNSTIVKNISNNHQCKYDNSNQHQQKTSTIFIS